MQYRGEMYLQLRILPPNEQCVEEFIICFREEQTWTTRTLFRRDTIITTETIYS